MRQNKENREMSIIWVPLARIGDMNPQFEYPSLRDPVTDEFSYDIRSGKLAPIQELVWASRTQLPIQESLEVMKKLIVKEKDKDTFLLLFNSKETNKQVLLDWSFESIEETNPLVDETAWLHHLEKSPEADAIHEKILQRYRKHLANLEISLCSPDLYRITSIPGLVGYYVPALISRMGLSDARSLGRLWGTLLFPREGTGNKEGVNPYAKELYEVISIDPADYLTFTFPDARFLDLNGKDMPLPPQLEKVLHFSSDNFARLGSLALMSNKRTPGWALVRSFNAFVKAFDDIVVKERASLDAMHLDFLRTYILSPKRKREDILAFAYKPYRWLNQALEDSPHFREEDRVISALLFSGE